MTSQTGVNNSKLLASSKKEARSIIEEANNFFILYFQIAALPFDGPSSFFKQSFFIFEEAKFDLHNNSGPIIQVSYYFFHHKKKLAP